MKAAARKFVLITEAAILFSGALFYMAIASVSRAIWVRFKSA